jgi:hypothetical protein
VVGVWQELTVGDVGLMVVVGDIDTEETSWTKYVVCSMNLQVH